jgi:NADH:ubiquinone oxidoreductase subunit 5 (subunit L)/multisubunit Na+/H+ antiporter MnhA subunit
MLIGLYTSLYSRVAALFEQDAKKVVALSTLSHLGFIRVAIFSGRLNLAFIHLLSHALFKSLLFICIGDLIHLRRHRQDSRHISSTLRLAPVSSLYINFSIFNLLGLPFFSSFYSKDLVLEAASSSFWSPIIFLLIYANLLFSSLYTLKIYRSCFSFSSFSSLHLRDKRGVVSRLLISSLGLFSVVGIRSIL